MSKISEYADLAGFPATDDILPMVDISDTSMAATGTTKKLTAYELHGPDWLRQVTFRQAGLLGESVPRWSQMSAISPGAGNRLLAAVALPAGVAVGHLAFASGAASNSPTHSWFELFDSAGVLLAMTADQTTTVWTLQTYKSLAVAQIASGAAASFTTTYTGLYYLGIVQVGGTPATILGTAQTNGAPAGQAPVLSAAGGASITVPESFPFTASIGAASVNIPWGQALT